MSFSVSANRISSILKKSTVSAQGYDMSSLEDILPACRHLLFPLLHAEKGRLRNAVANRVPASRWQGTILFRINYEIISGYKYFTHPSTNPSAPQNISPGPYVSRGCLKFRVGDIYPRSCVSRDICQRGLDIIKSNRFCYFIQNKRFYIERNLCV